MRPTSTPAKSGVDQRFVNQASLPPQTFQLGLGLGIPELRRPRPFPLPDRIVRPSSRGLSRAAFRRRTSSSPCQSSANSPEITGHVLEACQRVLVETIVFHAPTSERLCGKQVIVSHRGPSPNA